MAIVNTVLDTGTQKYIFTISLNNGGYMKEVSVELGKVYTIQYLKEAKNVLRTGRILNVVMNKNFKQKSYILFDLSTDNSAIQERIHICQIQNIYDEDDDSDSSNSGSNSDDSSDNNSHHHHKPCHPCDHHHHDCNDDIVPDRVILDMLDKEFGKDESAPSRPERPGCNCSDVLDEDIENMLDEEFGDDDTND